MIAITGCTSGEVDATLVAIDPISVYRHVQTLGMQVAYITNTPQGIRRWVQRLMAIPLVPPIRVQGVYQRIVAQVPNIPQAAAMHQYMSDTYLDPNNALFPIDTWNVFGTENRTRPIMSERFYLAVNQAVSLKHPSLFRLTDTIKEFESSSERALPQLTLGAQPKRRNHN